MGGGILPVAFHKNELYFLFGLENNMDDTPGWADFGGGKMPFRRPSEQGVSQEWRP